MCGVGVEFVLGDMRLGVGVVVVFCELRFCFLDVFFRDWFRFCFCFRNCWGCFGLGGGGGGMIGVEGICFGLLGMVGVGVVL